MRSTSQQFQTGQHVTSMDLVRRVCTRDRGTAFPRRKASGFWLALVPLQTQRGRRESRVHAAPAVSRARCTKRCAHEHTGSAEAIRPSLRNGFTAYNVLSPVTGFVATVIPEKLASHELDTSVGVSGPHDFAVRKLSALVFSAACVHRIPLHVRDDRERPSCGAGRRGL